MTTIDFILNLAALLLWVNWRSATPSLQRTGLTLAVTLKRVTTRSQKRWLYLLALIALLIVRTVFYWHIGAALGWTALIDLGPITLQFRSDFFDRTATFSAMSFGLTLGIWYTSLLLISVVNCSVPDTDPFQRFVRLNLGFIERWPAWLKLTAPLLGSILCWIALAPLLANLGVVPAAAGVSRMAAQGAVLGIGSFLAWPYVIGAVLLFHVFHSYVYLGERPFWNFITLTGQNLLKPLAVLPLRLGKVDFAPMLMLGVTIAAARLLSSAIAVAYPRFQI